jgi:hypothetical protein
MSTVTAALVPAALAAGLLSTSVCTQQPARPAPNPNEQRVPGVPGSSPALPRRRSALSRPRPESRSSRIRSLA